jgi:hypothetical protein
MLSHYRINNGAKLYLMDHMRGMISNFDSKDITNSLISYLLFGDEEHRANTSIVNTEQIYFQRFVTMNNLIYLMKAKLI